MTMTVTCTNCSAAVTVDAAVLRGHATICDYCGTLLHVTEQGMRESEYVAQFQQRQPPEGVIVQRGGGMLSVEAPVSAGKNSYSFGFIPLPRLIAIGVAAFFLNCMFFFILPFVPCGVIFVVALGGLYLLLARKPRVYIQNEVLHAEITPGWIVRKIPVDEVQQLYIATNKMLDWTYRHLYALHRDGQRTYLYGPLVSDEVAFFMEELLEIEMGLFNLPVVGESSADLESVSGAPSALKTHTCANCAGDLEETAAARRQGFITCRFCSTVTLLYPPNSRKPLLGLPDPASENLQFRIQRKGDNWRVLDNRGTARITVRAGLVEGVEAGSQFFLKEHLKTELTPENVFLPTQFMKLAERMAYSSEGLVEGDSQEEQIRNWFLANRSFALVAKAPDGRERTLLDGIRAPGEAALLYLMLNRSAEA